MKQLFALVFRMADYISQIFPFEAHPEYILFPEGELGLNVFYDFRRSRSRQCQNRNVWQQFPYFGYLKVGRAEVISPLGYAVRFVNSNQAHFHIMEFGLENLCSQPFGRYVKEFVVAENAVFQGDDDFFTCHPGINGGRLDAPLTEIVHLVFH